MKRLLRRKMQASDRQEYLQNLVSELNKSGERQRIWPGEALIQLQSPHWELYREPAP